MKKKAFTLIELLVVIVIIGILSSISVATFDTYKENAYKVKLLAEAAQSEKQAIEKAISKSGQFYVVAYDFNNVGENSIQDNAQNANPYTFTPSATRSISGDDAIEGPGSLFLNGETFYIALPMPTTNSMSISAMIKLKSIPATSSSVIRINAGGGGSDTDRLGIFSSSFNGGTLRGNVYTNSLNTFLTDTFKFELEKWYNLIVSYDESDLSFYVNSKLIGTIPVSELLQFDTPQGLQLGYSPAGNEFHGYIDRLRVIPGAYTPD